MSNELPEFRIRTDDRDPFEINPHSHLQRFPRGPAPQVVMWFRVYIVLLALVYICLAVVSLSMIFIPVDDPEMSEVAARVMGLIMLIMGLGLAILFLSPLFLKPKPWVWTYDLILICIGMTGCTIVVCIPLLIHWVKPETKQYFGKLD